MKEDLDFFLFRIESIHIFFSFIYDPGTFNLVRIPESMRQNISTLISKT